MAVDQLADEKHPRAPRIKLKRKVYDRVPFKPDDPEHLCIDCEAAEWREGRVADVYTFRNGKVIEFRTFGDERQAVQWAGVQVSDPSGDATGRTGAA